MKAHDLKEPSVKNFKVTRFENLRCTKEKNEQTLSKITKYSTFDFNSQQEKVFHNHHCEFINRFSVHEAR